MLTESFVASILRSGKTSTSHTHKDSGIFIHDYQPLPSLKSTFEKSSTNPNCLSATSSHIFAAQADKSVVLVYNVERENPDLIPFPERISSLTLIGEPDEASILALGTGEGRVILWELCTGRQVSTPRAHLEAVSCLVVDTTYNYLLTGSPDSKIHVWSIPALLSYYSPTSYHAGQPSANAPLCSLLHHRAAVTSLTTGHSRRSTDIAISGSQDNTCIVWDYRTGTLLHTFIMHSTPLCLALDPVDRAFYAGFEDGSIQLVDLFKIPSASNPIMSGELSATPTQPNAKERWFPESLSTSLALAVSYDGTTILSGHEDGKIYAWDASQGRVAASALSDLMAPVTNIIMLSPSGFPISKKLKAKMVSVVRPWHGEALNNDYHGTNRDMIPENYTFTAQFASSLPTPRFTGIQEETNSLMSNFDGALNHPSFPKTFLEDSLSIFTTQNPGEKPRSSTRADCELQEEVSSLKEQLAHSRTMQLLHAESATDLREEVLRLQRERTMKRRAKHIKRIKRAKADEIMRKRYMGEEISKDDEKDDEDMESDREDVSSTTDELTDSE